MEIPRSSQMKTASGGGSDTVAATTSGGTITRAQLCEAVQRALSAIDTVRAHVRTNRLHHAKEDFFQSALWMVEGPLYLTDLGEAAAGETERLERAISQVRFRIQTALELVEDCRAQHPIDLLSGVLTLLEEKLRAAAQTKDSKHAAVVAGPFVTAATIEEMDA